jgi:hypothetical protein
MLMMFLSRVRNPATGTTNIYVPCGCVVVGMRWCWDPSMHTWEEYFLLRLFARSGFLHHHTLIDESEFDLEMLFQRSGQGRPQCE